MAKRTKLRVGPTIVIGVLTLVVCVGIGFLYVDGEPGNRTTAVIGYAALGLALVAVLMLGLGLALLIHRDKHSD